MTQIPSIEEALQRADEAIAKRMEYVREALEARQALIEIEEANERERTELEERIKARTKPAQQEDRKAYRGAVRAGWTEQELREIGLPEPGSTATPKRRPRRKPKPKSNTPPTPVAEPHDQHSDSGATPA